MEMPALAHAPLIDATTGTERRCSRKTRLLSSSTQTRRRQGSPSQRAGPGPQKPFRSKPTQKARPAPVYVGSVWHQWSWHMAGYPGTWYFYATSVLIHRIDHGNTYHFGNDKNLGQNPAGGGSNG